MESKIKMFAVKMGRINPRMVQFIVLVLSLALFAIGAGAPDAGGGIVH